MTRRLLIALASAVLLLASLGGHALADSSGIPTDPCAPGLDDSSWVPPNPI
jgi:hypothetical protein